MSGTLEPLEAYKKHKSEHRCCDVLEHYVLSNFKGPSRPLSVSETLVATCKGQLRQFIHDGSYDALTRELEILRLGTPEQQTVLQAIAPKLMKTVLDYPENFEDPRQIRLVWALLQYAKSIENYYVFEPVVPAALVAVAVHPACCDDFASHFFYLEHARQSRFGVMHSVSDFNAKDAVGNTVSFYLLCRAYHSRELNEAFSAVSRSDSVVDSVVEPGVQVADSHELKFFSSFSQSVGPLLDEWLTHQNNASYPMWTLFFLYRQSRFLQEILKTEFDFFDQSFLNGFFPWKETGQSLLHVIALYIHDDPDFFEKFFEELSELMQPDCTRTTAFMILAQRRCERILRNFFWEDLNAFLDGMPTDTERQREEKRNLQEIFQGLKQTLTNGTKKNSEGLTVDEDDSGLPCKMVALKSSSMSDPGEIYLQNLVQRLGARTQRLEETNLALQMNNKDLETQRDDASKTAQAVQKANQELLVRVEEQREELNEKTKCLCEALEAQERLEKSMKTLTKKIKELEKKSARAQKPSERPATNTSEASDAKIEALQKQYVSTKKTIDELQKKNDRLNQIIQNLEVQRFEEQRKFQKLSELIAAEKGENQLLSNKVKTAEAAVAVEKESQTKFRATKELETLRLSKEIEALTARITELEENISSLERSAKARVELIGFSTDVVSINSELAPAPMSVSVSPSVASSSREAKSLEKLIEYCHALRASFDIQFARVVDQRKFLEQENARFRKEIAFLNGSLLGLCQQILHMRWMLETQGGSTPGMVVASQNPDLLARLSEEIYLLNNVVKRLLEDGKHFSFVLDEHQQNMSVVMQGGCDGRLPLNQSRRSGGDALSPPRSATVVSPTSPSNGSVVSKVGEVVVVPPPAVVEKALPSDTLETVSP